MSSNNTYQHNNNQGIRIIVAGGGTGGHIFPAIAIANAIKKIAPQTTFLFVGAKGKMEMEKIPQAGYKIEGLDIAGFNRNSLMKNIGLPYKLIKSFFQVSKIFKQFKPTAVIGVGGYSSFPVLRYAQSQHIPTFLHESNSFAGKSNIMLGKKATKIFTATDGMQQFFPTNKLVVTGNPVRQAISNSTIQKNEAIQFFNLAANKKTVLVVGGSLGAQSINDCIAQNIALFNEHEVQLIWQTGKPFYNQAKQIVKGYNNIFMSDFITQMEYAYAAADVVVSRSGAMAVAELCLVKKPVVFVPYPYAAEDHQTANAMALVNKKAAIMVNDKQVMPLLMNTLWELVSNDTTQQQLKENITTLAINNADEIIAQQIVAAIQTV